MKRVIWQYHIPKEERKRARLLSVPHRPKVYSAKDMHDYIASTRELVTKPVQRDKNPRLEHLLYIMLKDVTLSKLPINEGYGLDEFVVADESNADALAWSAGGNCKFPALISFNNLQDIQGDKRNEYIIDRLGFLYFKYQDNSEEKYIINMDARPYPERENSVITKTIEEFRNKLTTLTMLW